MRLLTKLAVMEIAIASCVGCDQATKSIAYECLSGRETVQVAGGLVRLTYVENPGALLSLGARLPAQARFWLLSVAVAVALAILAIATLVDHRSRLSRVLWVGVVVGGGVGNLLDRLSRGVVRDFLNLGVGPERTGIFNLADVALILGSLGLIVASCLDRHDDGGPPRAGTPRLEDGEAK